MKARYTSQQIPLPTTANLKIEDLRTAFINLISIYYIARGSVWV